MDEEDQALAARTPSLPSLPPFNQWGLLPSGIHDVSYDEAERHFAFTESRKAQWQKVRSLIDWVKQTNNFSHVYVAGSFVTANGDPPSVYAILQPKEPFGPEALSAMQPVLKQGLDVLVETYGIRVYFWYDGAPIEAVDIRSLFQRVSSEDAHPFRSLSSVRKGIIRLALD
jgi:hypothetical protein